MTTLRAGPLLQMIDRQDELVDEVGHTVGRLKEYAHQINDELESQEQYVGRERLWDNTIVVTVADRLDGAFLLLPMPLGSSTSWTTRWTARRAACRRPSKR